MKFEGITDKKQSNFFVINMNENKTLKRILLGAALLCVVVVIGYIFYWRPFFGLMDDFENIQFVEHCRRFGFLHIWGQYVFDDIRAGGRGMFRPLYPVMIWLLYGVGGTNPLPLFLINAVIVFGVYLLIAFSLAKVIRSTDRAALFGRSINDSELILTIILTLLALPFDYYLFVCPSLQEKLVFIAVAIAFYFFSSRRVNALPFSQWVVVMMGIIFFGFCQKPQFAVFLPAFAIQQWVADSTAKRVRRERFFALCIVALGWIVFTKFIAARGAYTAHLGFSHVFVNLEAHWPPRLLLLSAIAVFGAARERRNGGWIFLLPAAIALSYLAIFLQWGVDGYLLITVAPAVALFVAFFVQYVAKIKPEWKLKELVLIVLAATAVGVTLQRSQIYLSRWADLRTVIRSAEAREIVQNHGVLLMTCEEGSVGMKYYFKRFAGIDMPIILTPDSPKSLDGIKQRPVYWLGGGPNFCPVSDTGKRILVEPYRKNGFRLLKDLRVNS